MCRTRLTTSTDEPRHTERTHSAVVEAGLLMRGRLQKRLSDSSAWQGIGAKAHSDVVGIAVESGVDKDEGSNSRART
jgi:hypothetical protein